MKNWLYVVGGVLVFAALGWATWEAMRQPREPVYEGHPISYWIAPPIAGAAYTPPPPEAAWVRQVIGDANAVPFLIKALKRDSWVGATYYRKWLWPKLPPSIQSHLPPPSGGRDAARMHVVNAAILLLQMGPIAKPAIPALVLTLKEDENANVRTWAAAALSNLGKGDKTATAALTEALKDKASPVRAWATNALRKIDPEAAAKAGVKTPSP
jgi:HEAT repeat protein